VNKKSISIETLGVIVIILISLFAIGYGIKVWAERISSKSDVEACRMSVIARAKALIPYTEIPLAKFPLNCKTRFIEIKREQDINKTLAEELRKCWYQFGEGGLDFMPRKRGEFLFICAKIVFSKEVKEKYHTINLGDYLYNNYIPNEPYTYFEYITGKHELPTEQLKYFNNIPTNEPIYIGFYMIKKYRWKEILEKISKVAGVGAAAGAVGGPGGILAGAIFGGVVGAVVETGVIFLGVAGKYTNTTSAMVIIGNSKDLEKFAVK